MKLVVKIGLSDVRVKKESGSLHCKDKNGTHSPIKYGAYVAHEEPLGLKEYCTLKGIEPEDACRELKEIGAVLLGPRFNINFHEYESALEFARINKTN